MDPSGRQPSSILSCCILTDITKKRRGFLGVESFRRSGWAREANGGLPVGPAAASKTEHTYGKVLPGSSRPRMRVAWSWQAPQKKRNATEKSCPRSSSETGSPSRTPLLSCGGPQEPQNGHNLASASDEQKQKDDPGVMLAAAAAVRFRSSVACDV